MKRIALVAFGFLTMLAPAVGAEEPPHFKLVEGLRKRGMHSLALEYLNDLQKRQNPPLPDAIKLLIPLEIAKTQAEAAAKERDNAKRDQLFQKARRADLQDFVTKNPNHPMVGQAQFDLGRMFLDLGRAKAVEARHARGKEEQQAIGKEAVGHFQEANKSFEDSNKKLNERWNAVDSKLKDDKYRALSDYLLSVYSHGQSTYEMGLTQERALKDGQAAGKAIIAARDIFYKIADYKDQHYLGWEALAWHGRAVQQLDTKGADPIYKQVLDGRTEESKAGKRLVRYFKIVDTWGLGLGENERSRVRNALQEWREQFREFNGSPEGQHVRFMLAMMNSEELAKLTPLQRKAIAYKAMFNETRQLFKELEDEGGEYAAVAKSSKFGLLRLSDELLETPVALLASFDECLLRADIERANAFDALDKAEKDPKDKKALEQEAAVSFQSMIGACQRALRLLPEKARGEDWERIHLFLYIGYTQLNEPHRAVLVLESLARNPKTGNDTARRSAITALESYQAIYRNERSPAHKDADYERLIELAKFMDKQWPTGIETDAARYQLGFYLIRKEGDARAAVAKWEAINPKHPTYPEVNYRAGLLYWSLHAEAAQKAMKPDTIESPDRTKSVDLLRKAVDSGKQLVGPDGKKAELDPNSHVLASLALAEILNRLGLADDAVALVTPLVERLEAKELPADLPEGTDGRILGLALRMYVQKKDIPRALAILDSLGKSGGSDEEIVAVYRQLGDQLRTQIAALEAKSDPDSKRQLQQTRESLVELLASVDKKVESNPNTPTGLRVWLGGNYVSLGEHAKAARVFNTIPEPGPEPPAGAKPAEVVAFQAKVDAYQSAQFQKIKCMRLAALMEKDEKTKKEQLAKAEAELKVVAEKLKMQKHPNFVHEKILLLQLQEKYGGADGAIALWDQLRRALETYRDTTDRTKFYLRDLYFEACFNLVVCKFEEAKKVADADARGKAMSETASVLIPLMKIDALKKRFEEYVDHPDRKELKAKLGK